MTKGTHLDSLDSTGGSKLQITWAVSANQNITNDIWPELPEEPAMFRRKVTTLQQRKLAGALSPVNHTGLHQGWTQTSIYRQAIHSTSHYTTGLFPLKRQLLSTISERKNKQTKRIMFWSLFMFRGHSTQEPASGRVTYFILLAYTGTGMSHG